MARDSTHDPRKEVLSLVERGWRGARDCSLALSAMRIPVTHLIKGRLDADVQAMIRPFSSIAIMSVPRAWFPPTLWWVMIRGTLTGKLRWVLMDHERTWKFVAWWCRIFHLTPVMIQERGPTYELRVEQGVRSLNAVFHS